MIRGRNPAITMLELVGQLFLHGYEAPVETLDGGRQGNDPIRRWLQHPSLIYNLPAYPWHHEKLLWSESRFSIEYRNSRYPRHSLLGSIVPGGSGQTLTWRNVLRGEDHRLGETIIFRAAGYLEMALEAFRQSCSFAPGGSCFVHRKNVKFIAFLSLPNGKFATEVFTEMAPVQNSLLSASESGTTFTISNFANGLSTVHARGIISLSSKHDPRRMLQWKSRTALERQSSAPWYEQMKEEDLNLEMFSNVCLTSSLT